MFEPVFDEIENDALRDYVSENLDTMASYAQVRLDALGTLEREGAIGIQSIHAASEEHNAMLLGALIPDWDWAQVKAAIHKRLWNGFCDLEDGQGVPDEDWLTLFESEGVGRTIVEWAIVAAFAALGGVLGSTAGAVIGGSVGELLRELVIKFVVKVLDQEVKDSLGKFCTVLPE
jgi:hypothetical protein